MPKALTQEGYLNKSGLICPLCRCDFVEGTEINIDGAGAWQKVACTKCGATWNDIYKLTGYADLADSSGIGVPEGLFFEGDIGFSHVLCGDLPPVTYIRKLVNSDSRTICTVYMLDSSRLLELLNIWNYQADDWKYYTKV